MKPELLKKRYGNIVEGPNGKRMPEAIARAADEAMKKAPREAEMKYHRIAKTPAEFTLDEGSRTDISMITTDDVDREREVVMPDGIDTSTYNGVVTFAHDYAALPVGRSQWIKPKGNGLIAKTEYAKRPADWNEGWLPDAILSLMQEGTCTGKSIGFIPMSYREPTVEEIKKRPEFGMNYVGIIDSCVLLEYAVAPVPCNASAEMISVSKGFPADIQATIAAAAKEMQPAVMPICPTCKSNVAVVVKGEAHTCESCGDDFRGEFLYTQPKSIKSFYRPETIVAAVKRIREANQASVQKQIADALEDRIAKAMGRP